VSAGSDLMPSAAVTSDQLVKSAFLVRLATLAVALGGMVAHP
jgi:hypothetical protein